MTRNKALIFPGGGIFFYWMLGYMDHVRKNHDLEHVDMIGASAGALAMVCSLLELDPMAITDSAFRLMEKHQVSQRFLGLLGVWKIILREWLEEILPENAVDKLHGRVHVRLSLVPFGSMVVSEFKDRNDLLECLLATCHVPFFMDYRPFCRFRGTLCYDGDLGNKHMLTIFGQEHEYHMIDYTLDSNTHSYCRIEAIHHEHAFRLIQFGVDYAKSTSYWT